MAKKDSNFGSMQGRHDKFQFGTNPMKMSEFELSLAHKEQQERKEVTYKQILGMQGRDGGSFDHEQFCFDKPGIYHI